MIKKYIYLGLTAIIVFSLSIYILHKANNRNVYDNYLKEEYNKINDGKTNKISEKPDNPEMAMMQNYFMTIDPKEKRVPVERLSKAYEYTKKTLARQGIDPRGEIIMDKIESNMGGRTRGIMWDPNINNKVWACSVSGGLYYIDDISANGSKWNIVNNFWPGLSTSCITYDPSNKNTFYVGTGEYHTARNIYRESSGLGYGIWKTIDGGKTWDIIESTKDFKYISDIKVRNEDGKSVIYAGVVSGVYHGVLHESKPSEGLYRSIDNGQTWKQVLPKVEGTDLYFAPSDIEIAADGKIFVGSLKNVEGKGGATILSSTTGQKGSWTVFDDYRKLIEKNDLFPIPGRVVLGAAPSDRNIIYALVGAGYYNEFDFNFAQGNYILKSVDGGLTWKSMALPNDNPDWASLSWHAFTVTVNPTDPQNVFIGGLDLWKSINGGENWTRTSYWYLMNYGGGENYVHADQHQIAYKPNSSTEAIFSTDGGVFYSQNANMELPVYIEKSNNLSSLQFYACDMSPIAGDNTFVGGLQDNGTLLYNGSPLDISNMISGGDGAYCFIDKTDASRMITSVYYNRYYLFENANYIKNFGEYSGVFINPCDYDSKNSILYTNACTFTGHKSNRLLKISILQDTIINEYINLGTGLNTYFSNILVSPYSHEGKTTLFVGSQNGKLFEIKDSQKNPYSFDIGSPDFPLGYISSIAIGGSEDTLLVTFSNYGVQSVWETYNGGNTWNDISYNLPDIPIRWALYHPENANQKLLATELGIWSFDKNNIWKPNTTFPNVRVDMLRVRKSDNTVLAATHGQGLFFGRWEKKSVGIKEQITAKTIIYPNPTKDIINIDSKEKSFYSIFDLKGTVIKKGKVRKNKTEKVDLSNYDNGIYIVKINSQKDIIKVLKQN